MYSRFHKILKNSLKCNLCGDIIESTHVHDFKWCKCGRVAVDGGREYLKRVYNNLADIEDLSQSRKLTVAEFKSVLEYYKQQADLYSKTGASMDRYYEERIVELNEAFSEMYPGETL